MTWKDMSPVFGLVIALNVILATGEGHAQVPQGCVNDGRNIVCPNKRQTNAEGLTQEQVQKGCVNDGRNIVCPNKRQTNAEGLTQEQVQKGCVRDGRNIVCPNKRQTNADGLTREQVQKGCVRDGRNIVCPNKRDNGRPTVNSSQNSTNGLTQEQIKRGCVSQGKTMSCPSEGAPKRYNHTFETPQFGKNWKVYVPGTSYSTENRVEGTRTTHTGIGGNLPNNSLVIGANQTYQWVADGQVIRGTWVRSDSTTVVLRNGYEGRDWSATTEKFGDDKVGHLVLWSDNKKLQGK